MCAISVPMEIVKQRAKCCFFSELEIPSAVAIHGIRRSVITQKISNGAFVCWPSGKPCILVNQYLVDHAYEWGGDSPQTYAYQLVYLVNYCARRRKGFRGLTDGDVFQLVAELREERAGGSVERKRNDNTVRTIIHRALAFLFWLQKTVFRGELLLLGGPESGAPIIIIERRNPVSGKKELSHRAVPETVSTERKLPISRPVIESLEEAIESKANFDQMHERIRRTHGLDEEFSRSCVDYLWARRRFYLWINQTTGLRPGELDLLKINALESVLQEARAKGGVGTLDIPTLKRRRKEAPTRPFKLYGAQVEVVRRYVLAHGEWKRACQAHFGTDTLADGVFLGVGPGCFGKTIGKNALRADFEALCCEAKLGDHQVCPSMFRHRFITQEVRMLLKEFKMGNGVIITNHDYEVILERVRVKTGHASIQSLWHYIALAKNDDGLWDNLDTLEERKARIDLARDDATVLRRALQTGNLSPEQTIRSLSQIIEKLS